ncbi:hypothetical protein OKW22_001056 [Bacilli bacterium PM5-3]|nr:hypothetical protein [Bacilli bacterium PM5-3]
MKLFNKFLFNFLLCFIFIYVGVNASDNKATITPKFTNEYASTNYSVLNENPIMSNKNRYYELSDSIETIRSWYKPVSVDGKTVWFHFKNEIINLYFNSKNEVNFFFDTKNCSTDIKVHNCAVKASKNNARINSYVTTSTDNIKKAYYYKNNNSKHLYREKIWNSKNNLTKDIQYTLNGKGEITYKKIDERTYHSNNKLYTRNYEKYKYSYYKNVTVSIFDGSWFKKYNNKGMLTNYNKTNLYFVRAYTETRKYYSGSTKIKSKKVIVGKNTINCKRTAIKYTEYRKNGKKKLYKRMYYKKGQPTKMNYFVYNKQGQLKSNKYGNAYKYVTTFSNKKAIKATKAKYSSKGKLSKAKKVKLTNATKKV